MIDPVRAQYEALPYPPRDPRDEAIRLITGTPSHVLEINHYLFSGRLNFMRPFRALAMRVMDDSYRDLRGRRTSVPEHASVYPIGNGAWAVGIVNWVSVSIHD